MILPSELNDTSLMKPSANFDSLMLCISFECCSQYMLQPVSEEEDTCNVTNKGKCKKYRIHP